MKNLVNDKNILGKLKNIDKANYSREDLIDAIPAYEKDAITILDIMSKLEIPCDFIYKKSNDLVIKVNKGESEDKLTIKIKDEAKLFRASDAEKRRLQRTINDLIKSFGTIICLGEKNTPYKYYWESSALKNVALGREEISEERLMARAIAFQFVDEYLKEFLPPSIIKSLSDDLGEAKDDLKTRDFWRNKLQFHPSGFEVRPNPEIVIGYEDDWNQAYEALNKQYVIKVEYRTLHEGIMPEVVHLSLQKIQYVNHKVKVLAYVHEQDCVKTFEVARLRNIERSVIHSFKQVDYDNYEKDYEFEARVNVGVKDYFNSVNFGHNFQEPVKEYNDSWIIKATIKVPEHFSKDKKGQPDPFDIANFLSGCGDSMEVIKPDFLREEMKRRADNLSKLYSDKYNSIPIINKSPHEQTGNQERLKEKNL
jgi:hypothetical protein